MDKRDEKKRVKEIVREKLKSGLTKQQVFEELIQENNLGKELAKIIQSVPSFQSLKRFKTLHVLFFVLMIVLLIFLILNSDYPGIIWTIPMIYVIATKQSRYYGWAVWPSLYGLGPGISLILRPIAGSETSSIIFGAFIALISILISVLGFYLSAKLTPSYVESKELYQDDDGNSRYRLTIKFKE